MNASTATPEQFRAFLRRGPYEPLATRDQVLEVACSSCGATAGVSCDTRPPRPTLAAFAVKGMHGIHLRRYLDKTHDPR